MSLGDAVFCSARIELILNFQTEEKLTHALIDIVLPFPGGPWNNNPRFHGTPRSS